MIKANDNNGQESGLRAMILKLKKQIEGPAQSGKPVPETVAGMPACQNPGLPDVQ